MQIHRRTFLAGLLASTAATRLGAAPLASPRPDDLLLNRLTFGATPASRAQLAALGPAAWLEEQLAMPAQDPGLTARLAAQTLRMDYAAGDDGEGSSWPAVNELRPLSTLTADPASLLPLVDWSRPMDYAERNLPGREVIAASLTRAVHAPAQLREVMTQFWHEHFNVAALKDEFTAYQFPSHDAGLRERAFGNLRDLLGFVARSPAMLHYLNNADSRASPANENFARELLELHTLGAGNYLDIRSARDVPPGPDGIAVGYVDEDVYEVARAFTGWSVGDGRWIADGVEAPRTGQFHYIHIWHDPYQKIVLGQPFAPNRGPMEDGEQVLDILARHPGTARHICTKLARRFVADDPDPALVDRLAAIYLAQTDSPDQVAHILRALVADPAFAAPPAKLRRPFEFLAALYRASGAKVGAPDTGFDWQLSRAGWHQHQYPPPTGHPDTAALWLSSTFVLRLTDIALYAHDDWFGATTAPLAPPKLDTYGALIGHWTTRLHGHPGDTLPELVSAWGIDATTPLPTDEESLQGDSTAILAFAALTPAFLLR